MSDQTKIIQRIEYWIANNSATASLAELRAMRATVDKFPTINVSQLDAAIQAKSDALIDTSDFAEIVRAAQAIADQSVTLEIGDRIETDRTALACGKQLLKMDGTELDSSKYPLLAPLVDETLQQQGGSTVLRSDIENVLNENQTVWMSANGSIILYAATNGLIRRTRNAATGEITDTRIHTSSSNMSLSASDDGQVIAFVVNGYSTYYKNWITTIIVSNDGGATFSTWEQSAWHAQDFDNCVHVAPDGSSISAIMRTHSQTSTTTYFRLNNARVDLTDKSSTAIGAMLGMTGSTIARAVFSDDGLSVSLLDQSISGTYKTLRTTDGFTTFQTVEYPADYQCFADEISTAVDTQNASRRVVMDSKRNIAVATEDDGVTWFDVSSIMNATNKYGRSHAQESKKQAINGMFGEVAFTNAYLVITSSDSTGTQYINVFKIAENKATQIHLLEPELAFSSNTIVMSRNFINNTIKLANRYYNGTIWVVDAGVELKRGKFLVSDNDKTKIIADKVA